eukprot:7751599-Alexandrium_andersonii.AAC.1
MFSSLALSIGRAIGLTSSVVARMRAQVAARADEATAEATALNAAQRTCLQEEDTGVHTANTVDMMAAVTAICHCRNRNT